MLGNPCFITFLRASAVGSRANIRVLSGDINYDYVNAIDIDASSSYTPLLFGGHSTNAGNNLGITFAPTTTTGIIGLGPDQTVCGSSLPLTLNTFSFYPNPVTTFTWSGGANTSSLSVNTSGNYSVTVRYSAACTVTDNIAIAITAPTITASSAVLCAGTTSTLSALGANTYTWSNSSNATNIVVNPTITTTYSVVGTTTTGCVANAVTVVTVTSGPTVAIASVSNPTICSGNMSTITPSGASTYTLINTGATGTSFTVSPSASSTYSIIGATAGCISNNTIQQVITVNTTPTVGIASVSSPTICSGNNTLITPNGASTYTLVNTGATGTSFNVSPTGNITYTIIGTSSSNCNSNNNAQTAVIVNTTPTVAIASVSSPTICSGNSSTITPSGASSYTLVNTGATGTSFNVSPTANTTYTIIGASAANCNSGNNAQQVITVNTTPTVAIASVSSNSVCSGNSATITPSGANTYTLTSSTATLTSNPFVVSPTANTTYTLVGNSASNCRSNNNQNTTISIIGTPTIGLSSVSASTLCVGQSATITPNGATAGSYTLTPGNVVGTVFTVTPTNTTNYTINGANAGGCLSTASTDLNLTITVNATPTVAIASVSSPTICSGNNTTITASGASTYTLVNTGATGTSFNVSPTANTTYTIIGASAANCNSDNNVQQVITVNTTPTVAIASVSSNSICSGNSVTIAASGASTYTLISSTTTLTSNPFVVNPTASTTYTLVGSSALNCKSANPLSTVINVNTTPTVAIASVSNPTICSGNSSIITPSGASNYTLVNTGATGTSFNVNPTANTTYTIIGASAANCNSGNNTQQVITVNSTPTVAIASVGNPTICSGNNTIITPSGASTYTLVNTGATGTSFNISPTANTTYSIIGASSSNCNSNNTALTLITVNATPTITALAGNTGTICSGEVFTISPSGGSTGSYTLTNTGEISTTVFTVSPSSNTTYSINGTNTSGCVSTLATDLNVVLTVNSTPTVIANFSSNALCSSQSVSITVSGANGIYTLNPGAQTTTTPTNSFVISPPAGTTVYTITANNTNGCISTLAQQIYTTSVSVVTNPTITVSAITNSICAGNTASITPFGATTFTVINSANATTYTLSSGQTFTDTPTVATTYTINGTATGGCFSIPSTQFVSTIGINANPTITATSALSNTLCTGLSTTLTASGANSYTWASGPNTSDYVVTPNSTTVYTVTGTNAAGCTNNSVPTTLTVNVLSSPTLALATSISSNTLCSGNSATITLGGASAGSTYTLLPDFITGTTDIVITPSAAITDYTVIATDNITGCVSTTASQIYTTSVSISASPTISLASMVPSNTLCSGQSATITATGGLAGSYTLVNTNSSTEPFVVTPSVTTTYTISGVGANGCVSLANGNLVTTITVNQTPTISLVSVSPSQTLCSGQSATISVTGAASNSYTLQNTNATSNPFVVSPTVNTTYTISGTDANGCESLMSNNLTVDITIANGISLSTNVTSVSCNGGNDGQIIASASSGSSVTYSWSTGSNAPVVSGLSAGVYTLALSDSFNCTLTQTTNIEQPSAVVITEVSNKQSCDNDPTGEISINVTGGNASYIVNWSTGHTGFNSNTIPAGAITATITDANNCTTIFNSMISEEICLVTFIPQMFSPNGDGSNEFFSINTINSYPNNKLEIYSRWGNLVYSKEKYDNSFDGKANVSNTNGKGMLPANTYFVVFDFGDGKTPTYKGYLELKY